MTISHSLELASLKTSHALHMRNARIARIYNDRNQAAVSLKHAIETMLDIKSFKIQVVS